MPSYIYMYVFMYTYIYMYVCMYECMYVCMYVHIYVYMYICIYIQRLPPRQYLYFSTGKASKLRTSAAEVRATRIVIIPSEGGLHVCAPPPFPFTRHVPPARPPATTTCGRAAAAVAPCKTCDACKRQHTSAFAYCCCAPLEMPATLVIGSSRAASD